MLRAFVQGLDKGNRSVGKTKVRFRKAPKSDNVYIKLLVKVLQLLFARIAAWSALILDTQKREIRTS